MTKILSPYGMTITARSEREANAAMRDHVAWMTGDERKAAYRREVDEVLGARGAWRDVGMRDAHARPA